MLSENDLFVDRLLFSQIACLDGRAFGVETFCETCSLDFNPCLRRSLLAGLIANQALVESLVGYNLTERYHSEEILWDGRTRLQLSWPGVAAINVKAAYATLDTVSVEPYVILEAPVSDSGAGYCVVELDKNFIGNPTHAIIRDATTLDIYQQQLIDIYPRRNEAGNWEVALDSPATPPECPVVHVQHCNKIAITIDTPVCTGEIRIAYKGTTNLIPVAQDPVVDGASTTYWVYAWSLVDPAFSDETVNLKTGEFYKLVTEVDVVCVTEVAQTPTLTGTSSCNCSGVTLETLDTEYTLEIVSSELGVIAVNATDRCTLCLDGCETPIKIKIWYRTDPALLNVDGSLEALKIAITYLTAAELPLSTCGCPPGYFKAGFIFEAQKAYTDIRINPITGENIAMLRYGNLHGQLVFSERLNKAKKHSRLIRS